MVLVVAAEWKGGQLDANWDDWWVSPVSCSSFYRSAMKGDHNNYCLGWMVDRGRPANAAICAAPLHYDSRTFTPISKLENNSSSKKLSYCVQTTNKQDVQQKVQHRDQRNNQKAKETEWKRRQFRDSFENCKDFFD